MDRIPTKRRLAVVVSHPTQYYSPWFRHLAARPEIELKVFYLWDFGVRETRDRKFGTSFIWDIPLLDGYSHEFLPNQSSDPGTHHFKGLDNPSAIGKVHAWHPDDLLLFGYNYVTHLKLLLSPRLRHTRFLFRGDSHELQPASGWRPALSRKLRAIIFRRFSCFLAVGRANQDYFLNSGVRQEQISAVPHCVDNRRFQAAAPQAGTEAADWRGELGISPDATVVLFAGKFETKKRPGDLLAAFLELRKQRGDVEHSQPLVLLFVGSGPLEADLRQQAGGQLGKSVVFAPFQNQSQMPKVYATGDLLVLPSFGRGETWGLCVNEAMNLSRPAIVSSHVGCGPDLIIEGETGWTFPAGDPVALAAALAEATSDPRRLHEAGTKAAERISGWSYESAGDALLAALAR